MQPRSKLRLVRANKFPAAHPVALKLNHSYPQPTSLGMANSCIRWHTLDLHRFPPRENQVAHAIHQMVIRLDYFALLVPLIDTELHEPVLQALEYLQLAVGQELPGLIDASFYCVLALGKNQSKLPVGLNELETVELASASRCRINDAANPVTPRTNTLCVDDWLCLPSVVFAVEVDNAGFVVPGSPDSSRAIPSNVKCVCPGKVRWNLKIIDKDFAFRDGINSPASELRDSFGSSVSLVWWDAGKELILSLFCEVRNI